MENDYRKETLSSKITFKMKRIEANDEDTVKVVLQSDTSFIVKISDIFELIEEIVELEKNIASYRTITHTDFKKIKNIKE